MNNNLLKIITKNKEKFTPLIFTDKQLTILIKHQSKNKLTNSEKHALYTSIKKKTDALELLYNENSDLYIYGKNNILKSRIEKAKELLSRFSPKKAFIAGSFLFSEKYNDIDVFIIEKRGYKETHEDNLHIIQLTEKRLQSPIFQSAALISISNFEITGKKTIKPLKINEIMSAYHESVIEISKNQKREITRHIIFNHSILVENRIIDGKELKELTMSINMPKLEKMVSALIRKQFSNTYIYVALHDYIKILDNAIISERNNENLKRYKSLYEGIIDRSRRSKAESA